MIGAPQSGAEAERERTDEGHTDHQQSREAVGTQKFTRPVCRRFAAGDYGTIMKSSDGASTWSSQSSGTKNFLNGVSCTDASHCVAVGSQGTILTTKDGLTCRDFLASYLRRQGRETWMQGEACRAKQGAWEVKSLRPWSRS